MLEAEASRNLLRMSSPARSCQTPLLASPPREMRQDRSACGAARCPIRWIDGRPEVNVDGVLYGNYRSSLAGCDLNRQWKDPNPMIHPEVSGLLKELTIRDSTVR